MNRIVKRFFLILVALCGLTGSTPSLQGRDGVGPDGGGLITYLDWDELRIDSTLPAYTEVVPLETDYRLYDYSVNIEYPEWAPLTKAEAQQVERIGQPIGEELNVRSHVSVSRKQGMLDISFVPIVRRNGKYHKLLNACISISAEPKVKDERLEVRGERLKVKGEGERYAKKSVLAEGRWVKISITEDGMYRLTRSALKKMGFSNPDNVRLYGYGGHRLPEVSRPESEYDDLEEVPLYKAGSDTWLFWGNGLVYWQGETRIFNPYARQACYFLTEGNSPSEIKTVTSTATPSQVYTTFTDHVLHEKDEAAWFHGGRNLYDGVNYANSSTHTYKLSTVASQGKERLTVAFTNGDKSSTELKTTVNGNVVSTLTLGGKAQYVYGTAATRTTDVSQYANGADWTVKLTSTSGNDARLDYLALHYERKLAAASGYVAFSQSMSGPAQFNIVGANVQVMRIGEPGDPACLVKGTQSDVQYSVVVDDASRRYVAFDVNYVFPQPTVVGTIENQNLHAMEPVDMVIIVPTGGKLTAQAERLAEAHKQYDGLRVAVVRADQIFNEFSSGTPDATAYRRLMKMLYDRAQSDEDAPRYLLLFGDCAWDNRMVSNAWRNYNPDDYLLCFESENSLSDTQCFVMEDYFGLLDDGEGARLTDDKTDLGVGRFPVTTANEAKALVDKTINHMSNAYAGNWKNIICVMGDDGDNNEHLWMADTVAERTIRLNPEMEVRKVMWDAYTRVSTLTSNTYPEVTKIIKDQMDEGALVMNYTGHAATYCLSHEFVLKLEDFSAFEGKRLPLWITAACDVMPFDGQTDNVGETAIRNENGAAVAFIGTSRTVYATLNLQLNKWLMYYLLGTDASGRRYRVGDALRLAKNYLINNGLESFHAENKLHYALLGDPALMFGAPTNRVVLDSINGVFLKNVSDLQLQAGQHVRMSGHLENAQGEPLTDFDGILTARIYDNLVNIVCKRNDPEVGEAYQFTNREKVLFNGQDSVRAGKFSISYVMPIDINFSDKDGRAVFYALSEERDVEANGFYEDFTVGGICQTADSDTEGPHIYVYLEREDFENGGRVPSTPYFTAQMQDASGISYSGNGLGHDLLLTVDGDASQTYVLNNYYEGVFGDYTQGTVSYQIPEIAPGRHTLTFRAWDVLNNTSLATLDFVVDTQLNPENLRIYDVSGRLMATGNVSANQLPQGVYIYRQGKQKGKKIIVHGNK